MRNDLKLLREYTLLAATAYTAMDLYYSLLYCQDLQIVSQRRKPPKHANLLPPIERTLNLIWTLETLANSHLLPKHKDIVNRAHANLRICFDALTVEGDGVLYDEPRNEIDFRRQRSVLRLAWEWCGAEFMHISVACKTELDLRRAGPTETQTALGMPMADFLKLSANQIEELIDAWEPMKAKSTVGARNDEWSKLSSDGKSAKEIVAEWRQRTGEVVTPVAVRQGISRSRYKR